MKKLISEYKKIRSNKIYRPMLDVGLFAILLMSFHYIYIAWAGTGYRPFGDQVDSLFVFASDILFNQSTWILSNIFRLEHTTQDQTIWVITSTGQWGYVEVSPGCTSLKQWMHWIFIMTLFYGPWKHKLWYIPAGIIVIHFVNIIRIVGLSLTLVPWPQHFDTFHDYFFKTFFYFMIFVMWVVWVEFFTSNRLSKTKL